SDFPDSFGGLVLLAVRSGLAIIVLMGVNAILRPILLSIPVLKQFTTVATIEWIVKVCRIFLGSICMITVLEWWGVHVTAFLTGLGFFGAAIVLGAQDLFKNLISGFLILAEKRFNHGDWIQVDNFVEGYVESIGFRSTLLKRTDGAPIYVPNSRLSDVAVVNFAGIDYRRVYWRISLDPKITFLALKTVRGRFDKAICDLPKAPRRPDSAIFVYVDALTETSVDIILSCFLPFSSMETFLKEREAFACILAHIVEEAGTHFVLPKFALSSHTTNNNTPEVFVPPLEDS
ncbi:MAG: mechanosensitive ion channel family protein, partial [Holosporales bacterium]|nr:mechanosensitive ion channel family protein [Holosporales bacterium]